MLGDAKGVSCDYCFIVVREGVGEGDLFTENNRSIVGVTLAMPSAPVIVQARDECFSIASNAAWHKVPWLT